MERSPIEEFSAGGQVLYQHLTNLHNDASTQALIVEAARTKDRLDRLNRITNGDEDTWCRIFHGEGEIVLKMDTAVSEQRQLATVFRQLLAEIQRRQGDQGSGDEEDGFAGL